jgi:PAS domain S-box-containing protein
VAVIRGRARDVLARWEEALRRDGPGQDLPRPALIDHVPELLEAVAATLSGGPSPRWEAISHADDRLSAGYGVRDVVVELAALRDVVIEVREEEGPLAQGEGTALSRVFDAVTVAAVDQLSRALRDADRARQDASAQLEALFQSAPVGLAFWDRDLRFVRLNRWLAEVNGLPVEAHLGRSPAELFPGLDGLEELQHRWHEILETGEPWIGAELTGETPAAAGVRRHWREDFFPVRRGGVVVGIGAVVMETTEARRAAARLEFLAHASQELAQAVTDEAVLGRIARLAVPELADLCAVARVDGERLAGRVVAEAADEDLAAAWRALVEGPGDGPAAKVFGRVLRDGQPEVVPAVRGSRPAGAPDAETRALLQRLGLRSFLAVPLREHGRIVGALALATARSRRVLELDDLAFVEELGRRCAVALENARLLHEARADAERRDRVLAFVSHDLRNPLSTVLLGASRLAGLDVPGPEGERVRAASDQIRRSVDRMRRLIDDLLDAAAVESGQLTVHPESSAAAALVAEAVEAFAATARERGVVLVAEAAPGLPPVRADHDRVIQALGNLISNAIKVSAPGRRVAVSAVFECAAVVFRVADEGPGIPDADRPHLFEPYRRGASAGYRGTGLGLAITRGIVVAHGGRIWVETTPGRGTTFSFTIPPAAGGAEDATASP